MALAPTLTQYLLERLANRPDQQELTMIMGDIATIGKFISGETNRAGLVDILGTTGSENVQGEAVQKLDVLANEKCKEYLKSTGNFAAMASEEEEHIVDMGDAGKDAQYIVAFDPLDGSSNIDVNVSIGTIFAVHKLLPDLDRTDPKQFLQKGRDQVLAGYVLYGSSTVIVFCFGGDVHEFTLDPPSGEWLLSNEAIKIPSGTKIYSVNEAYHTKFQERDQQFVDGLRASGEWKSRYIGSMVADIHRTLIKGGLFMYPLTKKGDVHVGRLRVNYELQPIAYLIEHAGGKAVDYTGKSILDLEPIELHERASFIAGSGDHIEAYLQI